MITPVDEQTASKRRETIARIEKRRQEPEQES